MVFVEKPVLASVPQSDAAVNTETSETNCQLYFDLQHSILTHFQKEAKLREKLKELAVV